MQVNRFFTVGLTKIKGRGQFKCPKCGVRISPDDKTDRVYTILDTIVKNADWTALHFIAKDVIAR